MRSIDLNTTKHGSSLAKTVEFSFRITSEISVAERIWVTSSRRLEYNIDVIIFDVSVTRIEDTQSTIVMKEPFCFTNNVSHERSKSRAEEL